MSGPPEAARSSRSGVRRRTQRDPSFRLDHEPRQHQQRQHDWNKPNRLMSEETLNQQNREFQPSSFPCATRRSSSVGPLSISKWRAVEPPCKALAFHIEWLSRKVKCVTRNVKSWSCMLWESTIVRSPRCGREGTLKNVNPDPTRSGLFTLAVK